MIVQVSQKIFMADDSKRMDADVELIRAVKLFHICNRFVASNKEIYVCDEINFSYIEGNYYCSNPECKKILPWQDVMADNLGTGWEGHA